MGRGPRLARQQYFLARQDLGGLAREVIFRSNFGLLCLFEGFFEKDALNV